jgi:MFS family permease
MRRYRRLLRTPGATRLMLAGAAARLPLGMSALAIILLVQHEFGGFGTAGLVTACFGVANGLAAPVRGRCVDRFGPVVVLTLTGVLQAAALVVLTAGAVAGDAPVVAASATASGALVPPVGAVMRATWARVLDEEELRTAAFALESVWVDVAYIAGPVLVGVLVVINPVAAVLALAGITLVATVLLATAPSSRGWSRSQAAAWWALGPIALSPVRVLLAVASLSVASLAAVELAITAFAIRAGSPGMSGPLLALLAVGSILGGVWWGAHSRTDGSPQRQLSGLLAACAAACALLSLVPTVWLLFPMLVLTGLPLAAISTVQFSLMARIAPSDGTAESFTWLGSAVQFGGAAGSAVAGAVIASAGPAAGMGLAAGLAAVGASVAALRGRGAWRAGDESRIGCDVDIAHAG